LGLSTQIAWNPRNSQVVFKGWFRMHFLKIDPQIQRCLLTPLLYICKNIGKKGDTLSGTTLHLM
jgi:hypothetical protein